MERAHRTIEFGSIHDIYGCLSNFYRCTVQFDGRTFSNAEAAWQSQKTSDPKIKDEFTTLSGSAAKKKGRSVKLRSDWNEVKDELMEKVLLAKFSQNEKLKTILVSTIGTDLVENTTGWHDNYWGNCSCPRCRRIEGQNKLGQALENVRYELARKCDGEDGRKYVMCIDIPEAELSAHSEAARIALLSEWKMLTTEFYVKVHPVDMDSFQKLCRCTEQFLSGLKNQKTISKPDYTLIEKISALRYLPDGYYTTSCDAETVHAIQAAIDALLTKIEVIDSSLKLNSRWDELISKTRQDQTSFDFDTFLRLFYDTYRKFKKVEDLANLDCRLIHALSCISALSRIIKMNHDGPGPEITCPENADNEENDILSKLDATRTLLLDFEFNLDIELQGWMSPTEFYTMMDICNPGCSPFVVDMKSLKQFKIDFNTAIEVAQDYNHWHSQTDPFYGNKY